MLKSILFKVVKEIILELLNNEDVIKFIKSQLKNLEK